MKVSITEKFLWDLYKFLDTSIKFIDASLGPRRSMARYLMNRDNPVFARYKRELPPKDFSKLVYYLKKHNYIKVENLRGKEGLLITKKGISKAFMASFSIEGKKKRKDSKWIMVIFDIPKYHQHSRYLLRSIFKNLGYKLFQQSVWVTPYDVHEKTEKALQLYNLDQYVKIFLIEQL